jgi:hypothetical protein
MSESLTDAQVLEQVRHLVKQGRIRWTAHIEERLAQRKFEKGQVKECLLRGYFEEPPTIPNRGGDIEYVFRMAAMVDGEQIRVAASLIPFRRVVAITVFDPDTQG